MRKPHFIPASAPSGFAAAVQATSYLHPLHERTEVEGELAARGVVGDVLLDMLLANASVNNRYFSMHFDGKQFAAAPSKPMESTRELEGWSRRAFRTCPFKMDTVLLLNPAARAMFLEQVSFRANCSKKLKEALVTLAAQRGQEFEHVAGELVAAGFEELDERLLVESSGMLLARYGLASDAWGGPPNFPLNIGVAQGVGVRLLLTAKEYKKTSGELALMCLAHALRKA